MKNLDGQINVQGECFDVRGTVTSDGCFMWMTDAQPRSMLQKMEVGPEDAFTHPDFPNGFPFIAVTRENLTRVLNDIDKHIDESEYDSDVEFFKKVATPGAEDELHGSLAFERMYDGIQGLVYDSDFASRGLPEREPRTFFIL